MGLPTVDHVGGEQVGAVRGSEVIPNRCAGHRDRCLQRVSRHGTGHTYHHEVIQAGLHRNQYRCRSKRAIVGREHQVQPVGCVVQHTHERQVRGVGQSTRCQADDRTSHQGSNHGVQTNPTGPGKQRLLGVVRCTCGNGVGDEASRLELTLRTHRKGGTGCTVAAQPLAAELTRTCSDLRSVCGVGNVVGVVLSQDTDRVSFHAKRIFDVVDDSHDDSFSGITRSACQTC